jgi:hypothetical protein
VDVSHAILLLHAGATFTMVGLVWFVQTVHYPLFARVGRGAFPAYEEAHVARTGRVVGPPMLLEAATALLLVPLAPEAVPEGLRWLSLALLAVVWISTAGLQVPRHRELSGGFDAGSHARLVATNWIRTVAWSLRGALVLAMLQAVVAAPR